MNDTVSFGYEDIDASEKTGRVGEVFSNVAAKYDIMNDAMSGGMHRPVSYTHLTLPTNREV